MTGAVVQETIWKPLPKQAVAMSCPAFELLYGGSKGSAKTDYLVACVLPILNKAHEKYVATGRKQHKCRIMVFRKNLEDLKDFIAKSFEIYPYFDAAMGTEGWHRNDKTWTFTSGATVTLRHLDGPTDHLGYNGHEFVALLFDEVQQIPFAAYAFLSWQVRSSDPEYAKLCMIRCTANPGGYDWVAKHFFIHEHKEGGKIFVVPVKDDKGNEFEITRAFIRARTSDNPYLPADYIARMTSNMSEDERAMYIDGDFDRVAGAFFSRLLQPRKHFVRSRPIPDSWIMGFGIDWGSDNPAACVVGAIDNDGCLWIIDELHMPGITGKHFGEQMQGMWARQKWSASKKWKTDEFYGLIDKQAFDSHNGPDATAGAGIASKGFRLFPAHKERYAGCNQLKERLRMNRAGNPQMVVFEDRCPNLCAALSQIKSDAPEKPEEYDPKSEHSHACDALRFLAMNFPVADTVAKDPVDEEVERWNRLLTRKSQMPTDAELMSSMSGGYGDA